MSLTGSLPEVRGSYTKAAPLRDLVWFRAAGSAEVLFRPADPDDLKAFLSAKSRPGPVQVIGVGSNLLVRDGGLPGITIRLSAAFGKISIEGTRVRAGAAALDANVARAAADAGIAGLEFLRGIPGTVGGALRMNAGCYGRETKDILVEATAVDGAGQQSVLSLEEMGFAYRKSNAPDDLIFVEAVFQGLTDDPEAIRKRMEDLVREREASQPVRARTGGSTFQNPPGKKAWQLIEAAGCRGLRNGDAQVSEKHCNFLINHGEARASELEALGEEVRRRVEANSGIRLEWEIKRMGVA
ncbi:MAG: UDP-N-acetylmuramate dehydrogenase [Alphaproteobacteria bacterium]|nr:UDP-N-acetylmuramate dehydrogenase [Alphaproteobacteria bacterium]